MNSRDYTIWLLPLFAAFALYFPGAVGHSPEPAAAVLGLAGLQQAVTPETSGQRASAETLVAEFLGADPSSISHQPLADYELSFLIATMPDPIDSGLGHLFNVHLAAIERAAEAMEYVLDRFEIPWTEKDASTGGATSKSRASTGNPGRASEPVSPRHHREPAVVLFRKPYGRQLLLLFLVGETPTGGIHKAALNDALQQIDGLCRQKAWPQCREMRLLAPTFSGSVDSLSLALNEFSSKAEWRFKIITGSATAIDKEKFVAGLRRPTEFAATVAHDRERTAVILDWITRRDKNPKIAFLVEAGTGYGQVTKQRGEEQNKQADERKAKTEPTARAIGERPEKTPILILPYPVHISQLRKAAEKAKASEKDATKEAPRLRPRNLALSLEEGDDAIDILPSFSKFETFSVELVLANLLATISKEGIRYVGLFSSDIRDQIFLAGEIRRHSPNVILFTVGADLLYLHSDVNLNFRGMLLATNYPLFNKNQLWTYPFEGEAFRVQFPTDTAQAVYNASLALLGRTERMLEYGHTFGGEHPSGAGKPPIWLASIGKDDIWPIAQLRNPDTGGYTYAASAVAGAQTAAGAQMNSVKLYSRRLLYIFVVLAVISLFFSVVLIVEYWPAKRPRPLVELRRRLPWAFELVGDALYRDVRAQRAIHLFAFTVALLTLAVLVARLLTRYWVDLPAACSIIAAPHRTLLPGLVLSLPAFAALLLVGRYFLENGFQSVGRDRGSRTSTIIPVLCMGASPVIVCAVGVVFLFQTCAMDGVDQFFFNLRMLNTGSGLSPLPPLFFAALGGFVYYVCGLRRLRALEELPADAMSGSRAYFMAFGDRSFAGLSDLEREVTRTLKCADFELPFASLVVAIVGVPGAYLFLLSLVPALEVASFYLFFGLIFLFVYVGLALTLLRFLCVWWALRKVLRRLDVHPLQATFKSLRAQWPNMPPLNLSASLNPLVALHFSVAWAASISRRTMHCTVLPVAGKRADALLERVHRSSSAAQWRNGLILRRAAQASLCRVSTVVAEILEPSWQAVPADDAERDRWLRDARLYLAAQCVAFFAHVCFQLKNLIWFLLAGFLLMLTAVSVYPFQPREWILWFNWVVILVTVGSMMLVFVQMNRDNILSQLSDTAPGRLSWSREFVMKILVYGAVPILALLGAQFPESLRQIVDAIGSLQGGQ